MSHDPHFLRPGRGVARSGIRRKRRLRLAVVIGFVFLVAAVGFSLLAYQFVTSPSHFQVRRIMVEGAEFASREELVEAVQRLTRKNVLLVDLKEVCAAVERVPWVRKARARKVLPDTLQLSVTERVPIAYVILGNAIHLTDDSGILVDRLRPEHPFIGLPVIRGVDSVGGAARRHRLRLAVAILADLKQRRPAWHERVSELDISEPRRLEIRLADRSFSLIVGDRDVIARMEKYFSIEEELLQRYDTIDYIDTRFQRRLNVKPGGTVDGGQAS